MTGSLGFTVTETVCATDPVEADPFIGALQARGVGGGRSSVDPARAAAHARERSRVQASLLRCPERDGDAQS